MKNYFISYLKWIAIILIMLVHLINWSDMPIDTFLFAFKDFCHIWTLYFVALSWSLIVIAYGKYDSLWKANKKLLKRAVILFGIYILYSLVKFQIFDFSKEPFYQSFIDAWKFDILSIVTFKTYVVPITILLLWCMFLFITPIILYINKKFKYRKEIILWLISLLVYFNYFVIFPRNTITEMLYWENFILYWFNLWLLPYLIWIYLWMIWFHKKRLEALIFFGILTIIFWIYQYNQNLTFYLDPYMFPLKPYFITSCFFIMYVFIYILIWISKFNNTSINYSLSILKLIWDKTLFIYITHWIIIDITIWIFRPNATIIWITVPVYLIWFLYYNREKVIKFKNELNSWNI